MKNKIFAILILAMFLLSAVAIAENTDDSDLTITTTDAETVSSGSGVDDGSTSTETDDGSDNSETDDGTADGEPTNAELQDYVEKDTKNRVSVQDCIKRVNQKYPKVKPVRAKKFCEIVLNTPHKIQPVAIRATNQGQDNQVGTSNGDGTRAMVRYEKCVKFLKQNTKVADPLKKCEEIAKQEKNCVDFLKENDVDEPLKKCDEFFKAMGDVIKDRKSIRDKLVSDKKLINAKIADKVGDFRLSKLNGLVDNGKLSGVETFISGLSDEQIETFMHLTRAEQKEIVEKKAKDKLSKLKVQKIKVQNLYQKRNIAEAKLKIADNQYQKAKKQFKLAKKVHAEKNKEWLNAKKELKEKCKDLESDECKAAEAEAIVLAKETLGNNIDMLIEHLNEIKSKIEGSDAISESRAEEITDAIDEAVAELNDLKEEVDAAVTKEEVKTAAKKLEKIWNKNKFKAQAFAAHILNSRVNVIIKKSEKLEDKLECAISQMEEQGIDTASINSKVDQFSEKIASADDSWGQAKDLYDEIRALMKDNKEGANNDAIKTKAEEMRKLAQEAHKTLQDAHKLLSDINKEIRASGVDITACKDNDLAADEEYVVVDETEEEEEEEETETDDNDDETETDDDDGTETDDDDETETDDDDDGTETDNDDGTETDDDEETETDDDDDGTETDNDDGTETDNDDGTETDDDDDGTDSDDDSDDTTGNNSSNNGNNTA